MCWKPPGTRDEGSVLVLSLLVTLLILGIGLTAMWVTSSGSRISGNLTRRQEAVYAAETGLDRARVVLRSWGNWPSLLDGSLCASTMDDPGGKGMVLCDTTQVPPIPLERARVIASGSATDTAIADIDKLTYTVYVRNDAYEYQWCNGTAEPGESAADIGDCDGDGDNDGDDQNIRRYADRDKRITVRVVGVARDGLSEVAVEAVVSAGVSPVGSSGYAQKGGSGGQGANAIPKAAIGASGP